MQLDKMVAFYKTMGDPTRIKIISLLANKPWNGQAIAEKLGLSAPTITHHLKKMRDINVVYERRDKNTIYSRKNKSYFYLCVHTQHLCHAISLNDE